MSFFLNKLWRIISNAIKQNKQNKTVIEIMLSALCASILNFRLKVLNIKSIFTIFLINIKQMKINLILLSNCQNLFSLSFKRNEVLEKNRKT